MILQSLVSCYEQLQQSGKIESPGWQQAKVSYGIRLDKEGNLKGIVPLLEERTVGKKKTMVPRIMNLPAQNKRTSGIASNFLCDNVAYLFGIDAKGKPDRARACFEDSRQMHLNLLEGLASDTAKALISYFEKWNPETAEQNEFIQPLLKELSTANLVFLVNNEFAHEDPAIRKKWQSKYDQGSEGTDKAQCLVTGEYLPVAILHPSIRGIQGAQASGASIVSFNADAFTSYGHDGEQGKNAPVSTSAAFAYGAALNYLLSQRNHTMRLGDTTIVFWAEGDDDGYVDLMQVCMGGEENTLTDDELKSIMTNLSRGLAVEWKDQTIRPENQFYLLGLAPNAARLSIRFFLNNSFGYFVSNVAKFQKELEIIRPSFEKEEMIPLWKVLRETVNPNAKDKTPLPQMAGNMTSAILMGTPFPMTFYNQIQIRIRAENAINRSKAASIKAFLLRNTNINNTPEQSEEVIQVSLNTETNNEPYVLGRLFAVLEMIQKKANPNINTTIRDRYFSSACTTPALVFPSLLNLAQAHLKKLGDKDSKYFNRLIGEIIGKLGETYPKQLSVYDQGAYQIGYYQQVQDFYTKKEDK